MNNIETFLNNKLLERNIDIDDFVSRCGKSKSTIYRIMKGYQKPSSSLTDTIINVLNLNKQEQQQFRYYSNLLDTDEELLNTREEVENLLFKPKQFEYKKIELVYYNSEKYIKSFEDILNELFSCSINHDFLCNLRIINCCDFNILKFIYETFSKFKENNKNLKIDHLVSFSKNFNKENILVLSEILPLLSFDFYSAFYCENNGTFSNSIFHDFMILNYEYKLENGEKVQNDLYISFIKGGLSECILVKDANLKDFFERAYESLQKDYSKILNNDTNFTNIGDLLVSLESNYDSCLIKPNLCYDRIPVNIYKNFLSRMSIQDKAKFIENLYNSSFTSNEVESKIEEMINQLNLRNSFSYKNVQHDIFTRKGLEDFAKTGKLSDHLDDLPAFNKKEIKDILEHIKKRDIDKKDKYEFFIVKDNLYNEDLIFIIFKEHGILIEYNSEKYKFKNFPHCLIEQKTLCNIFLDFADNYVPEMLSMQKNDAYEYIDYLISKYCN